MSKAEREVWRQYACAALVGLCSPEVAASYADQMLKLERKRFEARERGAVQGGRMHHSAGALTTERPGKK